MLPGEVYGFIELPSFDAGKDCIDKFDGKHQMRDTDAFLSLSIGTSWLYVGTLRPDTTEAELKVLMGGTDHVMGVNRDGVSGQPKHPFVVRSHLHLHVHLHLHQHVHLRVHMQLPIHLHGASARLLTFNAHTHISQRVQNPDYMLHNKDSGVQKQGAEYRVQSTESRILGDL